MQINKSMIETLEGKQFDLNDREQRIFFAQQKHARFINLKAGRFHSPACGYEDFEQEANLIICKAADDWDPNKSDAKFSSYVFSCLRNGLTDLSTRNQGAASVPSGSYLKETNHSKTFQLEEEILDTNSHTLEEVDVDDLIESFEHKEIARLYFVEGMTLQEISNEVEESIATIARKIERIKEVIVSRLKK